MTILALADEPCDALWCSLARQRMQGVDLILSCGDLRADYLEYLTNFTTAPIVFVRGNHDVHLPEGCTRADDRVVCWGGLRIAGLGGCVRYDPWGEYQFTVPEMERRAAHLRLAIRAAGGVDILLTHAPAAGLNDGPDFAHTGFDCFRRIIEEFHPAFFVHGHVHLQYNPMLPRVCTLGDTTVINAFERYTFQIPDELHTRPLPHAALTRLLPRLVTKL